MAKGGNKGGGSGGPGPGASSLLSVTGTDAREVLFGDLFYPENELLGYEIIGFGGDDVLIGGDNNDRLNGSEGLDVYFGGAGDDLFVDIDPSELSLDPSGTVDDANAALAAAGLSQFTLTHMIDGGDDTVDRSGNTVATSDAGDTILLESLNYVNLEDGVVGTIDETGTVGAAIATVTNIENVIARGADHTIIGNADPNHVDAGSGDDYVDGRAGNDFLDGARGNDVLIGGAGDDHLMGGRDADLFVVGLDDDVILDFSENEDAAKLDQTILDMGGIVAVSVVAGDAGLGRANRADTTLEISVDSTVIGTVTFVDATVDDHIFGV